MSDTLVANISKKVDDYDNNIQKLIDEFSETTNACSEGIEAAITHLANLEELKKTQQVATLKALKKSTAEIEYVPINLEKQFDQFLINQTNKASQLEQLLKQTNVFKGVSSNSKNLSFGKIKKEADMACRMLDKIRDANRRHISATRSLKRPFWAARSSIVWCTIWTAWPIPASRTFLFISSSTAWCWKTAAEAMPRTLRSTLPRAATPPLKRRSLR